jgi:uncharacterized SAM-binding protein YcdF (DUF218 family)
LVLVALFVIYVALFVLWRGHRLQVLIAGAVVFWLLGSWLAGPLVRLAQIGHDTTVEPTFKPRMALILLGGGTDFDASKRLVPRDDTVARIDAAARLYKRCRQAETKCRVIVSGGDPQHHGRTEAEVYTPFLLKAGIDPSDLLIEDRSMNTYENACNVDRLLRQDRYDAMVLITSSLHMRRALLAFDAFELHPQPYVASVRNPYSWWVPHREGWIDSDSALYEIAAVIRFRLWRWLGIY